MSAGELESGNAGEPAKLIRQRYREASDQIKKVRAGLGSQVCGSKCGVQWAERRVAEGQGVWV
jgi:hypothetical protein